MKKWAWPSTLHNFCVTISTLDRCLFKGWMQNFTGRVVTNWVTEFITIFTNDYFRTFYNRRVLFARKWYISTHFYHGGKRKGDTKLYFHIFNVTPYWGVADGLSWIPGEKKTHALISIYARTYTYLIHICVHEGTHHAPWRDAADGRWKIHRSKKHWVLNFSCLLWFVTPLFLNCELY